MFEVKRDNLGDVFLLTSQGVSFTEVQEGLNHLSTGMCLGLAEVLVGKNGVPGVKHAPWGSCSLPPGLGDLVSLYNVSTSFRVLQAPDSWSKYTTDVDLENLSCQPY